MRLSTLLVLVSVGTFTSNETSAQSIDPDARIVELRESCDVNGVMLDNCFETTAALTDWLWGGFTPPAGRTNEPNALDSVAVRVGPGNFDAFTCDATSASGARGFVSVLGSGRGDTSFEQPVAITHLPTYVCEGGITSIDCTGLTFSDLTATGIGTGVLWIGTGSSLWESVDMRVDTSAPPCAGGVYGWYDDFGESVGETPGAVHYFWSSRLSARGRAGTAAFSGTGESWFYGTDFVVTRTGPGTGGYVAAVRQASADGVRIFGSSVRAVGEVGSTGNVTGLNSTGPGAIHMHGGIINATVPSGTAVGTATDHVDGFIHTLETAFFLKGANPFLIRMYGPGTTQSPFIWPRGTTPPSVFSETGADFFVKTDDGPGQDEARLYVYDIGCSAVLTERWRSVTTGNCI